MEDILRLGGSIELSGFDLKRDEMVIVKKLVGNYVSRFEGRPNSFEGLKLHMKRIHNSENNNGRYEIHGKLRIDNNTHSSEITHPNLFMGLDMLLKKLHNITKE